MSLGKIKMTKVEKEALLALAKLGRRSWYTAEKITNVRLWMRYAKKEAEHWRGIECGEWPFRMPHRKYTSYYGGTRKGLNSLYDQSLADVMWDETNHEKLAPIYPPLFQITKVGQKLVKGCRNE